jgi:cytoskeletal protein RodZ
MTSSHPPVSHSRRRHGAHRTGHGIAGALLPSLLAVLAVASLITSLAVWRGEDPGQPSAAASTTSSKPTREALSQAPSSTASASTTPTGSHTKAAAGASTSAEETSSDSGTRPADFAVEVVVLNQTSRAGLAGQVATRLRGEGWTVPAVGNFRGVVPATTVYYPPGQEAAAQAAAESLPTTPRTRPRFGNLSTTRLTVVVTDTYPG